MGSTLLTSKCSLMGGGLKARVGEVPNIPG
jgi:hypothetical protein